MRRISRAMLCVGLVLGFVGCRASFQDIQKASLLSSGDDQGAKGDDGSKANPDPDYPILENIKELPEEDSASYGCDGIVVIKEKGKDKNLDGILQPTEVTDIKTECKPKGGKDPGGKDPGGKDPGGKDPGGKDPGKPGNPPQCPNQNDDKCPDRPDQNDDPNQNDPAQSGKK